MATTSATCVRLRGTMRDVLRRQPRRGDSDVTILKLGFWGSGTGSSVEPRPTEMCISTKHYDNTE